MTQVLNLGALTGRSNAYGATWGTPSGFIYGEDNTSGRINRFNLPVNGVNPTTPTVYVSEGSINEYSDGARCVNAAVV